MQSEPTPHSHHHGSDLTLARAPVGSVSLCGCGVLTLTMQYVSLRFEPGALRELQALLAAAHERLHRERSAVAIAPVAHGTASAAPESDDNDAGPAPALH